MAIRRKPVELTAEQKRQLDVLRDLVRGKGLDRFAFFLTSVEGLFMPDDTEEVSGCVVDGQGRVFSFWMEWDAEEGAPTLGQWEQIEPQPHWAEIREYQRARKAVGLDPA